MARIQLDSRVSSAVRRLERLDQQLGTLGMAAEAIEDEDQRNAMSVSIEDAREIVRDIADKMNGLANAEGMSDIDSETRSRSTLT